MSGLQYSVHVRDEFRKHGNVDARDFVAVEGLLRRGERLLGVCRAGGVRDVRRGD